MATSLPCALRAVEIIGKRKSESECAPIFRSISEPTCISSLQYSVLKISSISYPYQCLFVPSAQEGMGREKMSHTIRVKREIKSMNHDIYVAVIFGI